MISGNGQPDRRRDDQADQRDRERPPVRPQVAEQPAPRHATEAAHLANDGAGVRRDARELLGHGGDDGTRPARTAARRWVQVPQANAK